ncbi:MAG: pyrimidine 5'-nucleotidase [Rhodospirillales bacterium]|jgi:putative hydrolase of the HAD superfamily|tara:strand:+ start:5578 stop:6264 length:687 start_codon:yes stop_codon:yes gene_type:complete
MEKNHTKPILSSPFQSIDTWIFDLDNTLYPASSRLFDQVDRRITEYIMQALDLEWDDAHKKQKLFFREYGTSLSGMMEVHNIPANEYLEYVHNIDLSPLAPSPALNQALEQLPGRKVIFTNGSTAHAKNVTEKLGITHHFDATFDIVDCEFTPKPDLIVYEKMLSTLSINPKSAVMIEDMARNLVPAAALGITTVWVRTEEAWAVEGAGGDHIEHIVDDLTEWLNSIV